jgi:hypothetical protein
MYLYRVYTITLAFGPSLTSSGQSDSIRRSIRPTPSSPSWRARAAAWGSFCRCWRAKLCSVFFYRGAYARSSHHTARDPHML